MGRGTDVPILASLADFRELILACFEAGGVQTVAEIGADDGEFTAVLAEWAGNGARHIYTVEPEPCTALIKIVKRSANVELIRGRSPDCLSTIGACDAYVIDGDHNYHTVSAELRTIVAQASIATPPLILLHDVEWPWGRRDSYYKPELLPSDALRPHTFEGGVVPGVPGLVEIGVVNAGLWAAALEEGGASNGVQTAIDDFLASDSHYEYIAIPVIFGLGVLFPTAAPYAHAIHDLLQGFHDHPVLQRLEENRLQLVLAAQEGRQLSEQYQRVTDDHKHLLQERAAWIVERDRYESDAQLAGHQLRRLEAEHNQALANLRDQLTQAQNQAEQLRADRDRISLQLVESEKLIADQEHSIHTLERQLAESDRTIADILTSRSWRSTAWLRRIRRQVL